MTTTILGSNGKLGAMLGRYARHSDLGWRMQARKGAADILWSGTFEDPATDTVFRRNGTLINMIGATGTHEHQLTRLNVRFVHDLLTKAAASGVAHVVLASSAAVYGAAREEPLRETALLRPLTPYGESKVAMESLAEAFASRPNAPKITILRIGNVAGADALFAAARRHISSGTPMPLHRFDNGAAAVRSYIGPRDFSNAVRVLAKPPETGLRILNLSHPQPVGLDALLAAYHTHALPDLTWADETAPEGIPPRVVLSTETLQKIVPFQTYNDPADALGQQLAEFAAL